MSEKIILVEGLCKRYRLGKGGGGEGLRHVLEKLVRKEKEPAELFWALRDVSFEVQRGDVLGLVGANGAGKTTLLKILSRITRPTKGCVRLRGRVSSLLEVGTGFHPELSGRENIYLNGAVLGMSRGEIRRKFDEIVAFAEVEQFLDTPVKRYSSGMYVRLAFAVAAHLEPDILLVDEVLAVGDAAFQKKCLGKMREVSREEGRTILFVSHNMGVISALCRRALYLHAGRIALEGSPSECINTYLRKEFVAESKWTAAVQTEHPVQVTGLELFDVDLRAQNSFEAEDGFVADLTYEVRSPVANVVIELWVLSADGAIVMCLGEHDTNPALLEGRGPGLYRTRVRIPGNLLNLGTYYLRINSGIYHLQTYDHVDALRIEIVENRGKSARSNRRGAIAPLIPWERISETDLPQQDVQLSKVD